MCPALPPAPPPLRLQLMKHCTCYMGSACRVIPCKSVCLADTYSRKCVMLQSLDLSQSTLQGSLPPEWGQPQAFPSLMILNASFTQLTGPLPSAWGSPDAFLKLTNVSVVHTYITGGLPDSWATLGAWPQLVALQVDQTHIAGSCHHCHICHTSHTCHKARHICVGTFPHLQGLCFKSSKELSCTEQLSKLSCNGCKQMHVGFHQGCTTYNAS